MRDNYRYQFWVDGELTYAGFTHDVEQCKTKLRKQFGESGRMLVLNRPVDLAEGMKWEITQTRLGRPTQRNLHRLQAAKGTAVRDTYRYQFWVDRELAFAGFTKDIERSKIKLRKQFGEDGHMLVLNRPVDITEGMEWEITQTRLGRPTQRNLHRLQAERQA